MKWRAYLLAMVIGVSVVACDKDDDNDKNTVNATDKNFIMQATYGNKSEVAAGAIAASKGQRDSIKIFGQMMVTDHTMAQTSLDSIAGAVSVTPPAGPDSLHQAMAQQLLTLSGKTFDSVYINSQVTDHQKTISLFEDEIAHGQHQLVKNFANKNLPVIRMHYEMAVRLSSVR